MILFYSNNNNKEERTHLSYWKCIMRFLYGEKKYKSDTHVQLNYLNKCGKINEEFSVEKYCVGR